MKAFHQQKNIMREKSNKMCNMNKWKSKLQMPTTATQL